MISIEDQEELLLRISKKLKKEITVYAIGGTAMMFHGLKEATLDIDLVCKSKDDRDLFRNASMQCGYKEIDSVKIYERKDNHPIMVTNEKERFDLFLEKVINFIFSDTMRARALKSIQFGDTLLVKIADPHDLILMKCATDRLKDKDDVRNIINQRIIDWNTISKEAKHQVELGVEVAVMELGYFLEQLRKLDKKLVPIPILDELFEFVKKQAEEKLKHKSED